MPDSRIPAVVSNLRGMADSIAWNHHHVESTHIIWSKAIDVFQPKTTTRRRWKCFFSREKPTRFLLGWGLLGNDLIMLLDCRILRGGGMGFWDFCRGECPRNHGFLFFFRFLMVSQCCLRRSTRGCFTELGFSLVPKNWGKWSNYKEERKEDELSWIELKELYIHTHFSQLLRFVSFGGAPPPSNSDHLHYMF